MPSSDRTTGDANRYAEGDVPFDKYVIAVIDTPEEAQQTADALKAQGFAPADVVLSSPINRATPESEREQGTLADPPTRSETLFTEEGLAQEQYAEERKRGHVVIQVHAPDSDDVDRAHNVLVAHHAHTIKRVGPLTRENLPNGRDQR